MVNNRSCILSTATYRIFHELTPILAHGFYHRELFMSHEIDGVRKEEDRFNRYTRQRSWMSDLSSRIWTATLASYRILAVHWLEVFTGESFLYQEMENDSRFLSFRTFSRRVRILVG